MTGRLAEAKRVVVQHHDAIDRAAPGGYADAIARHTAEGLRWRGMHPFNKLVGAKEVAEAFWEPLRAAFGFLQRRPDMFLAGENWIDEGASVWVAEMGYLAGWIREPWLGIPPSGKMAMLRYCEWHRVEDGRIAETLIYCDIPAVMRQAGAWPLPPQTGAEFLVPGPRNHRGLLYRDQDEAEGRATLELVNAMVEDLVGGGTASPRAHLERFWTPDMCWFGPAGIGSSIGFDGYRAGHTAPFEEGLEFVRHNGHGARVGEGTFGGFFGYPSLTMKMTGNYLGMPASNVEADMRIVDMYRREGDRLAENWIFIDLLHFLKTLGLDVLKRIREVPR